MISVLVEFSSHQRQSTLKRSSDSASPHSKTTVGQLPAPRRGDGLNVESASFRPRVPSNVARPIGQRPTSSPSRWFCDEAWLQTLNESFVNPVWNDFDNQYFFVLEVNCGEPFEAGFAKTLDLLEPFLRYRDEYQVLSSTRVTGIKFIVEFVNRFL